MERTSTNLRDSGSSHLELDILYRMLKVGTSRSEDNVDL